MYNAYFHKCIQDEEKLNATKVSSDFEEATPVTWGLKAAYVGKEIFIHSLSVH